MELWLQNCYAECAILPPSPATEGARQTQPALGCLSACPGEIPPNCWCISNTWVKSAKSYNCSWNSGEGSHQQPQKGTKLLRGDDEPVRRSNSVSWKRNMNRALHSPGQAIPQRGCTSSPQPHVSTLFIASPSCSEPSQLWTAIFLPPALWWWLGTWRSLEKGNLASGI